MDCLQPMVSCSASIGLLALFYKQAQNKSALQYTIGVFIAISIICIILGFAGGCTSNYDRQNKRY
jgi:hypothetical protein